MLRRNRRRKLKKHSKESSKKIIFGKKFTNFPTKSWRNTWRSPTEILGQNLVGKDFSLEYYEIHKRIVKLFREVSGKIQEKVMGNSWT